MTEKYKANREPRRTRQEPAASAGTGQSRTSEATTRVVDVHFRSSGKAYYFDPGALELKPGQAVIIDTARGLEYGICDTAPHRVPSREIVPPLRRVIRLATPEDERIAEINHGKEKQAFEICQKKIAAHKLDMQLVAAEYAFDGSKLLFFFTADARVDFRELVKDLASVFRTRIELRQIGVRDKAKMVGGFGICGRPFCCREFLDDFQPVSIKMAKVQNLSLNPTKISGTCGRLMCCLKYEQEAYEDLVRTSPKVESFVDTPDGRGTVVDINLLRQSVKVRMEKQPETIATYANTDIYVLRNGKARKTDPPIPDDLAPISGKRKPRQEESLPALEEVRIRASDEPLESAEGGTHRRRRHRRSGGTSATQAAKPPAPVASTQQRHQEGNRQEVESRQEAGGHSTRRRHRRGNRHKRAE